MKLLAKDDTGSLRVLRPSFFAHRYGSRPREHLVTMASIDVMSHSHPGYLGKKEAGGSYLTVHSRTWATPPPPHLPVFQKTALLSPDNLT